MTEYSPQRITPEELIEEMKTAVGEYIAASEENGVYGDLSEQIMDIAKSRTRVPQKTIEIIAENTFTWLEKRMKLREAHKKTEILLRLYERRFPDLPTSATREIAKLIENPDSIEATDLNPVLKIFSENYIGILKRVNSFKPLPE
ncbi:hypothetical protein J4218_05485 [Candidatus Pacearchaeota archaeon]|nr:hypothetical protein [uncultured archaeon]MBS3079547.1 hypothetical protein [Candidatus Pacearchaeota archaeon]